jgi:ribonuclease HII
MPIDKKLERFYKTSDTIECGVDEAGRGPLFGRVYAAAVVLDPNIELHEYLFDSKCVTSKRRKLVRNWIEENALSYSVSWKDEKYIDKFNIAVSTIDAMHDAIRNLNIDPDIILVDGNQFTPLVSQAGLIIESITIVDGDRQYASIAAASILAKEYHDEYIYELCEKYPYLDDQYSLKKNKGYGTEYHRWAISKYGPTQYHRKSFLKKIKLIDIY